MMGKQGTRGDEESVGHAQVIVQLDVAALADELAVRLDSAFAADRSPWLDIPAAAAYLSCSEERIRKLIRERQIPFHQARSGGRIFLHRREIDEWLLAL